MVLWGLVYCCRESIGAGGEQFSSHCGGPGRQEAPRNNMPLRTNPSHQSFQGRPPSHQVPRPSSIAPLETKVSKFEPMGGILYSNIAGDHTYNQV